MITRFAIFEGRIKPGCEQAFHDYVASMMVPIWREFEGALDVRIFRALENDPALPDRPLTLAVTYADHVAMERALSGDVRVRSREATVKLMDLLDGRLLHAVYEVSVFAPIHPGPKE